MVTIDKYKIQLGLAIRKLRSELVVSSNDSKGVSQERFADLVGIHRTYIGAVERGERNISLANMVKISTALGMNLSELLRYAEELE